MLEILPQDGLDLDYERDEFNKLVSILQYKLDQENSSSS
jgi:hypothetical protein